MQQTLFALAAILSFAYLGLGQQRHHNDVERQAITAEAELAATDVALARMSALERLAFDEDDTGREGIRVEASTLPLGSDESSRADYDDVDDWTGITETIAVPVGRDSLRFERTVTVQYVDDENPGDASSTPTLTKEIVVSVVEIPPATTDRPAAQAQLRRVVTPASVATYIHQNS